MYFCHPMSLIAIPPTLKSGITRTPVCLKPFQIIQAVDGLGQRVAQFAGFHLVECLQLMHLVERLIKAVTDTFLFLVGFSNISPILLPFRLHFVLLSIHQHRDLTAHASNLSRASSRTAASGLFIAFPPRR